MSRLAKSWSPAAQRLGVTVAGPVSIATAEGGHIPAPMLVAHFGAERGTVVFTELQAEAVYAALQDLGYAYSTFGGEPGDGDFIADADAVEVLNDWGWCGPADEKPAWAS